MTVPKIFQLIFHFSLMGLLLILVGPPGFRDGVHFYGPQFEYLFQELYSGGLPLWNPYENFGQPMAENPTSLVFYPITYLAWFGFCSGLSSANCYTGFAFAHLCLCFMSAYRLARYFRHYRASSTLAGFAYALGGQILFQWNNIPFLISAAWFPEALLQADRTIRGPAHCRSAMLLAVTAGMMILGGDPQATYHLMICCLILWFVQIFSPRERATMLRSLLWLVAAGLLTGLLSAVLLLPAWQWGQLSDRALPAHRASSLFFSVPPWRLAEMAWPGLGGWQFPINRRWFSALPGETMIWAPSYYLGTLVSVFALAFMVRIRRSREWALLLIFILFTLGSLGSTGFVYPLLQQLPGYGLFRYPAKLLSISVLIWTLFAAGGFDRALRSKRIRRRVQQAYLFIGVAVPLILIVLFTQSVFTPVPTCPLFGPFSMEHALLGFGFSAVSVLVMYLLYRLITMEGAQLKQRMSFWVPALVFLDLILANTWMLAVDTSGRSIYSTTRHLEPSAPTRFYRTPIWTPSSFAQRSSPNRLSESAAWDQAALMPKYNLPLRLGIVDVRGTMMSAQYYQLANQLRKGLRDANPLEFERKLEQWGVSYIAAAPQYELDADEIPISGLEDVRLWHLPNAVQPHYRYWSSNELIVQLTMDQPGTYVFYEQYWPGWRAFLDEQEIPIKAEQGVFRAIELPQGTHQVRMIYDPPLVRYGLRLSLAGLVLVLVILVFSAVTPSKFVFWQSI